MSSSQQLTIEQALVKAIGAHKSGDLQEAERLYRVILQVQPQHSDANHNLGVLAVAVGQSEAALPFFKTALETNPKQGQFWISYIDTLIKTNQLETAHQVLQQGKYRGLAGDALDALEKQLNPPIDVPSKSDSTQEHLTPAIASREAGKYREAQECLKIESANPSQDQINALVNLYHSGQMIKTEKACRELLQTYPQSLIVINISGAALQKQGKLQEAVQAYSKAIQLKPDFAEAYSNRGNALKDLGQLKEAIESIDKAIQLMPDFAEAYYNRGNVLKDLGQLKEAVASYDKAIQLKPDLAEVYSTRGHALQHLGQLEEAVKDMQIAVEKDPDNSLISDFLINLLNYYMPNVETRGPYAKIQELLQQVSTEDLGGHRIITDEAVQQIYRQYNSILTLHKFDINTNITQLYRGTIIDRGGCSRHKTVFDRFKVIPEYCFDCYKVTIGPRTVMELFKIFLLFDRLKLPNDNPRKCIVEVRPGISGTYKGFIYCQSLNEANEILSIVQTIVDEIVSKEIPIVVKRGCSEFQIAYPAYGHITGNGTQLMIYNEEWRKYEVYVDKNLILHTDHNPNNFTSNHPGLTLHDVLVMRNWLVYAATIGDLNYLQISGSHDFCTTDTLKNLMNKRPSFRPLKVTRLKSI